MRSVTESGGDEHVLEQLVRFVLGGLAVVPRGRRLDAGRDHVALQCLYLLQGPLGDMGRVGALLLRDRYGDRLVEPVLVRACAAGPKPMKT